MLFYPYPWMEGVDGVASGAELPTYPLQKNQTIVVQLKRRFQKKLKTENRMP